MVALAAVALLGACSKTDDTSDASAGTAKPNDTSAPSGTTAGTTKPTASSSVPAGEIERVQAQLNDVGCDAGTPDGKMGPGTQAALRHFQYATGEEPSGQITDTTRAALATASSDGTTVCTADNVPRDDYGEPDCYVGVDEGCESTGGQPDGTPTDDIEEGTREVARGQYVTSAGTCPNGLAPGQVGDVTVEITNVGASRPVIEGTASASSYGTQTWTYNWETGAFSWTSDFCAGRDVAE